MNRNRLKTWNEKAISEQLIMYAKNKFQVLPRQGSYLKGK